MLKNLNAQNIEAELSRGTALVDFYADWCGPCKMIAPIIEEIAAERDDITIGKINVDNDTAVALKHNVVSIPTLILFKNGVEVTRIVGYRPKEDILAIL